jgi:hypothetical protein
MAQMTNDLNSVSEKAFFTFLDIQNFERFYFCESERKGLQTVVAYPETF